MARSFDKEVIRTVEVDRIDGNMIRYSRLDSTGYLLLLRNKLSLVLRSNAGHV